MYANINNDPITYHQHLPKSWTFTDGTSTGNFDAMPQAAIKAAGFLPVRYVNQNFDQALFTQGEQIVEVGADEVVITYPLTPIPEEELAAQALQAINSSRNNKIQAVNSLRDNKLNSGFTWSGKLYDTNPPSLLNITAVAASVALGETLPEGFKWRAHDNTDTVMDADDVRSFAIAARDYVNSIYAVSFFHKDTLTTLETLEAINGYDIQAGW